MTGTDEQATRAAQEQGKVDALFRRASSAWRPPPRLKLSEWADQNFFLSAESAAEPGRWRTIPYQRGIMDAITDRSVTFVTLMKSARVGATKIFDAAIGYYIDQDPATIMVVQPTVEDAQGYSKEEIAPMLRDCPSLTHKVSEPRAKDGANTILHKVFPGGSLSVVGANSARGFRRVSRKIILFDEVDGYPPSAGSEGDQIKLGIRRSEYYWDRKICRASTPTLAGASRIEAAFLEGDQRRYYAPCPSCGHMDILVFRRESERGHWMQWPEGKPQEAHFVCRRSGCVIEHHQKRDMVAAGEWRSEAPFRGHASFHIWAAYSFSPNATWGQIAEEFLEAQKAGVEQLKTFVNTALGETWQEKGDAPDWMRLYQRRELYEIGTVSEPVIFLTGGVDVQKDRLVYEVVGWGDDKQSWGIEAGILHGDTASEEAPVWRELDQLLERSWARAGGAGEPISALAVDSGYNTNVVYSWARRHARSRVIATKGVASQRMLLSQPSKVDVTVRGKRLVRGFRVWPVGVDVAKAELYGWLQLDPPTQADQPHPRGYCHYPQYGEDYFKQLTAEQLVEVVNRKTGFRTHQWQLLPGRENHWLDARVLARAAAARLGLDRLVPPKRAPAVTSTVPEHLREYVQYIRTTGRVPLPTVQFDEDWEPIGPRLRADLVAAGLVVETQEGLRLVDHGAPQANTRPPPPAPPATKKPKPPRRPGGWLGGTGGGGSWLKKGR